MRLHLAEVSSERGQYKMVADLQHRSHLFSYAYKSGEKYWAELWESMNLHLADKSGARVLIDSGAFTAYTLGKPIGIKEYLTWAEGFRERWEDRLAFLRFFNLDVIGDQDATWRNHTYLEKEGLNPIAIVTFGAGVRHLERALEYDYISIGGLVPYTQQKSKLKAYLDKAFGVFVRHYKKTGVMPKVHLLGVAQKWILESYPAYSADASSWVQVLRFGSGRAAGINQVPKVGENAGANLLVLRREIEKIMALETYVTKLWAKRGIEWKD